MKYKINDNEPIEVKTLNLRNLSFDFNATVPCGEDEGDELEFQFEDEEEQDSFTYLIISTAKQMSEYLKDKRAEEMVGGSFPYEIFNSMFGGFPPMDMVPNCEENVIDMEEKEDDSEHTGEED